MLDAFTVWKLDWQRGDLARTHFITEVAPVVQYLFAFAPDGRHLAVGRIDKLVILYDLTTGRSTRQVALETIPYHLAFYPRDDTLAVDSGPDVILFEVATGRERIRLHHGNEIQEVSHVAWHPDGHRLAAACDFYILAMSHHELSNAVKAKDYFQHAVRWHESQEQNLDDRSRAELNAFRAEAKEILDSLRARREIKRAYDTIRR